ncbi:MAG: hypothetical protein U0667_14650 [Chloroflexota bacterium]
MALLLGILIMPGLVPGVAGEDPASAELAAHAALDARADRKGGCFTAGEFTWEVPTPEELTALIAANGGRPGSVGEGYIGNAKDVAAAVGGELVGVDGSEAYVMMKDQKSAYVDIYTMVVSSKGDDFWLRTGNLRATSC